MTLSAFSKGLEGLLESLCARPGRWILIVERGDRSHLFRQALAFEDGSLCHRNRVESLPARRVPLVAPEEELLLEFGWEWHMKPYLTNWINVQATTIPEIDSVSEPGPSYVEGAQRDGSRRHRCSSRCSRVRSRGDTPASPEY